MQRMEQATTRERHGGFFTEVRSRRGALHRRRETDAVGGGDNEV